MTEATEQALEGISGGILFCIAISLVLLLHQTFSRGIRELQMPGQSVFFYEEDTAWRHSEE